MRKIPEYKVDELENFFVMEEKIEFKKGKCIPGFERLWIWQRAYKLMRAIHNFCRTLRGQERFKIRDQVERSSSSVYDNIAEGYSSYYYDDKIRGLNTARKEAGESQNHIRKLIGKGYIEPKLAHQEWVDEYKEIVRGINGSIRYIRNKKGRK